MRIVALVESEEHVCCRYRVAAFRDSFAAAGHQLDIQPLPRTPFGRLVIGRRLAGADAVIVQRKLLPRWALAVVRRHARRLLFDFDDAVWLRDSYSARGLDDPRRARRFRAMVAACNRVIAGNDYLAAEAARYTTIDRVSVIPTCVDPAIYPLRSHGEREGIRLVWVGSHSTLRGLERFGEALSAIGRAVPQVRLKLICDQFLDLPDLTIERCLWNGQTEASEIAAADVGISWVPDDSWSRGKCGLKVLQYQAAGLPVIANPVGVQSEMVRDNVTGFLATTAGDWVASVRRLTDAALRRRLGETARREVETRYSVAAGARRWLALLQETAPLLRQSG